MRSARFLQEIRREPERADTQVRLYTSSGVGENKKSGRTCVRFLLCLRLDDGDVQLVQLLLRDPHAVGPHGGPGLKKAGQAKPVRPKIFPFGKCLNALTRGAPLARCEVTRGNLRRG